MVLSSPGYVDNLFGYSENLVVSHAENAGPKNAVNTSVIWVGFVVCVTGLNTDLYINIILISVHLLDL